MGWVSIALVMQMWLSATARTIGYQWNSTTESLRYIDMVVFHFMSGTAEANTAAGWACWFA